VASERKRDKRSAIATILLQPKRAVNATFLNEQTTVQARIRASWIDLLRRNRGAEGKPETYYALNVENIRGRGEEFELNLTFRAGQTYCCCEDLCHTGVFTEQRWRELRVALAIHGVEPKEPLVVRICTRLEAGARLHYGRSSEPEAEVSPQGPWTLTVREFTA
jgi:hypothetical protein